MMQNAPYTYITYTIFDYHYCWNFEWQKIFKFKTPTLQVWKLQNHLDAAVLIEDFSMVSRVQPQFPKNLHSNSPKKFRSEFLSNINSWKILKIQQAERPAEVSPAPH